MICPKCAYRMYEMGCTVSGLPLHWCQSCGTIRSCDGVVTSPIIVDQYKKEVAKNKEKQ